MPSFSVFVTLTKKNRKQETKTLPTLFFLVRRPGESEPAYTHLTNPLPSPVKSRPSTPRIGNLTPRIEPWSIAWGANPPTNQNNLGTKLYQTCCLCFSFLFSFPSYFLLVPWIAASVFGNHLRLEPLHPEKKLMWRREMNCLLSVCDYIVELVPKSKDLHDGTTLEVKTWFIFSSDSHRFLQNSLKISLF